MHALQRKKTMFENVNIDWHLTPDEGSTDFSDDEGLLDDNKHHLLNGSRTPDRKGGAVTPTLLSSPDNNNSGVNVSGGGGASEWCKDSVWFFKAQRIAIIVLCPSMFLV